MSFLVNFWLGLGNPRHIATISQHLWAFPRQIRFWSILKKSWDWVRPPPPPWAKIPTFTENLFWRLPSDQDHTLREGSQDQMLPKCRHCLNGGGGSDPCLDFCEGFVHMHWGPSKVIIHHPEVIISKQKTVLKYNNNQFQFIEINY